MWTYNRTRKVYRWEAPSGNIYEVERSRGRWLLRTWLAYYLAWAEPPREYPTLRAAQMVAEAYEAALADMRSLA